MSRILPQAARLIRSFPRAWSGIGGFVLLWGAVCFLLGYRLPFPDRHPEWATFPNLTNPHLVIEEIPDSVFRPRYGRRFALPADVTEDTLITGDWPFEAHRQELKNVRSVGFQTTENEFDTGLDFHWTGGNETGRTSSPAQPGFRNFGLEYLKLQLGSETGYFKDKHAVWATSLDAFYQYNRPSGSHDTLFLRYGPFHTNYRVYVSAQPQRRELEWGVTNQTDDPLWVTVRFALDSVRLTPQEQALFRQTHEVRPPVDAAGKPRERGPVDHMAWHNNQWYWVFGRSRINAFADYLPYPRAEIVNLSAGIIRYGLSQSGTQGLLRTPLTASPPSAPPIAGLWVRRAISDRTVSWQGPQLQGLFQPSNSVENHTPALDRLILTVGPGLRPELSWWASAKRLFD